MGVASINPDMSTCNIHTELVYEVQKKHRELPKQEDNRKLPACKISGIKIGHMRPRKRTEIKKKKQQTSCKIHWKI
jgi:hypothetical protein